MPLPEGPIAPFDGQDGVWLRSAFHVHTTESDGWFTPVMQRRAHAWAHYDVLAITDHDMYTQEPPGDDGLLIIGGTELSMTAPKSGGPLHLLGIGITEQPKVDRSATLTEAAKAVKAAGGLPFLAHPIWSGLRTDEVDGIEECAGVEIYNASCDVEQDRAHAATHTDLWLTMGHRFNLIATDDTHYPGFDDFRGWTMVHARERTRDAFMEALAAGRNYASTGPRITGISVEDGVLSVSCTPVRGIAALCNPPYGAQIRAGSHALAYRGQRRGTIDGHALEGLNDGEHLTGATFRWVPGIRYCRIMVTDHQGRRAWSNPIWAE
jgi:predicted metal-dependent phosphoesterase TrpH